MTKQEKIENAARAILRVEGFEVAWPLSSEGRKNPRWIEAVKKAEAAFAEFSKAMS